MRLIDADDLYRKVKTECNKYGKPTICFDCGNKVLDLIDYAPTVEERPQGEWKETGYETGALGITYRQTQCSNCGWAHALSMWLNFCPNCGAKMGGGAE